MIPKVIVFDFDGVLVDSNALKYDAFFKLFSESEQEVVTRVLSRRLNKTRFEILEEVFQELKNPPEQIKILTADYAIRYNNLVQDGIFNRGLVPGTQDTIPAR